MTMYDLRGRFAVVGGKERGGLGAFASEEKPGLVCVWQDIGDSTAEFYVSPDEADRAARNLELAAIDARAIGSAA